MTGAPTMLAELLAECDAHGIRLLLDGDGGLTIDAPSAALTPALLGRLKAHKAGILLALVEATDTDDVGSLEKGNAEFPNNSHDVPADFSQQFPRRAGGSNNCPPKKRRDTSQILASEIGGTDRVLADERLACPRCGSQLRRDVPIHDGRSVRRDCGQCGRFLDFIVWYGTNT